MSDYEIIHFAGPVCTFGTVARQRCQWCGALIDEKDITRIAVREAGRPAELQGKPVTFDELAWWDGLVAVSGSNPRLYKTVTEPDDAKAPERSFMVLFEGLDTGYGVAL